MCITSTGKWSIIFSLCIICYSFLSAQVVKVTVTESPAPGTITEDTVYYGKNRPLRWSDFTGRVRQQSPSAALSFSGFSYDAGILVKPDTIHVHLFLQTYFVRSGSWVRPGENNTYALSHEQLHFDIAKISEIKFKDSVLRDHLSPEYYPMEIKMIFLDAWRKMNDLQETFDRDTRHGTNHSKETEWERKITRKLLSDSDPG